MLTGCLDIPANFSFVPLLGGALHPEWGTEFERITRYAEEASLSSWFKAE
jgi:hypothetical protein